MHFNRFVFLAGLVCFGSLTGCATLCKPPAATPQNFYQPVKLDTSGWGDEVADLASFKQALDNSLLYYGTRNENETIQLGMARYTIRDLKDSLLMIRDYLQAPGQALGPAFFEFLQANFDAYIPATATYVTAYCTPKLRGSFTASEKYAYPIYRIPDDLVEIDAKAFKACDVDLPGAGFLVGRLTTDKRVEPYYTRQEIDFRGVLKNRHCEWLWVDNAADRYFLQVEGSGIIELEDGSTTRVAYAGQNGQPCHLIGKLLRDERILSRSQLSGPGIKKYLTEHPGAWEHIFSYDPSYVFFEPAAGEFATGCFNVPVTDFRSIATDRKLFPPGMLAFLETTMPILDKNLHRIGEKKVHTLVFSQDTGGVIRGPGRVDWYVGSGPQAEALAGNIGGEGRLVLLVKKKTALP